MPSWYVNSATYFCLHSFICSDVSIQLQNAYPYRRGFTHRIAHAKRIRAAKTFGSQTHGRFSQYQYPGRDLSHRCLFWHPLYWTWRIISLYDPQSKYQTQNRWSQSFLLLLTSLTSLQNKILGQKHAIQSRGTNPEPSWIHWNICSTFFISPLAPQKAFTMIQSKLKSCFLRAENSKRDRTSIELFNATIIQSDDHGFFLLMPDNIIGEANQNKFIDRLSSTLPSGITLMLSHHYKKMLCYRK